MQFRTALIAATLAGAILAVAAPPAAVAADNALRLEASSQEMVWNAVAVHAGRIYVAGPRWTDGKGPALAMLDRDGRPRAYPDGAWNGWRPGQDPAHAFVNVNAIHLDGQGSLWAIDTGAPDFGGDPLPQGAKAVRIDLASGRVTRVIAFGPGVALPGSYIDDIRFNGRRAYLTDAGRPGLIVLDLDSGAARRVLDGHPSVTAPKGRHIDVAGTVVRGADGQPLAVNADPFELSPDGATLYFGSLSGPWSQVPTRLLDDPAVPAAALAAAVRPWADIPPVGGTAIDGAGNLYYADLRSTSIVRRSPDGKLTTLVRDPALHWVDAPVIADGRLWLPVPQMDRMRAFNGGVSRVQWPIRLYSIALEERP
ncbi:hypothetical protein B0920_14645 [Massilia sp. KIM]|uniref:L-dopachrome tautomerase-related protein n=1 Tax=Massilia sp. KIM TaxID=1955422 RepID=UPI00098EAB67|nr:L-dopachrome tautomerase-related protein [Massilia sp. KIM]OON64511.1 hypothetical protein B0920_14645 [Massilia sp. KIM]